MRRKKKEIMPSARSEPEGRWPEMDRFFERMKYDLENFLSPGDETRMPFRKMITPEDYVPVDLSDEGDHFELKAELPGHKKDDVEVEVTDGSVQISMKGGSEKEDSGKDYVIRERSSFSSSRTINLPEKILSEKADGSMNDGILNLNLPKENPKPKNEARKIKLK